MSDASCSTLSSSEPHRKNVLLFGKTGAGKSTVANVLVTGGLERELFKSSDGATGCTQKLQIGSDRGWTVVDTVGLGSAEDRSVKDKDAKRMLTNFLKDVQNRYSHIIYVIKADRITSLDVAIWEVFKNIFEGAEPGFVVLLTDANEDWLEKEWDRLPLYIKDLGRDRVLVTDIPRIETGVKESRNVAKRKKSILKLEEDLENLFQKRDYQFVVPKIADMSEPELREMATSIIGRIVVAMKRLLESDKLQAAASMFRNLVDITSFFVGVVSIAAS